MVALSSSAISDATYDKDTQDLTLTFTNGRSYTFAGVPEALYDKLLQDPSPGEFFNTYLKGRY